MGKKTRGKKTKEREQKAPTQNEEKTPQPKAQKEEATKTEDKKEAHPSINEAPKPESGPASWGFLKRFVIVSAGACALFLAYPRFDLWPLAYVALVPLLLVTRGLKPWRAFGWGAWAGFITNFGGFYWISTLLKDFGHMDGWIAWTLCVVLAWVQGLVFALWAWWIALAEKRGVHWPIWAVALPAMLAIEFLFPMLFPWYLGNSQYLFLPAVQIAELFGVLAVSAEVLLLNLAIWSLLDWKLRTPQKPLPWRFPAVATAIVITAWGYGVVRVGQIDAIQEEAKKLKIGLVEGDIGIWEKEDRKKLNNNILIHQNLSAEVEAQGAELIIWPESSYQSPYIWGTTSDSDDPLYLKADSLFVPAFRDRYLPAARILEKAFGRPLDEIPRFHKTYHIALASAARGNGFDKIPSGFPGRCGEQFKTHLRCPFRRVPPDDVTYFLPGYEDLQPDKKTDRAAGTLLWNQLAVQRGFDAPLIFGGVSMRAPEGVNMTYKELLQASNRERELFNVAYVVDREGRVLDNYKKVYLLLFGEKIPFADQIPWIYKLIPEAGSFTAGTETKVVEIDGIQVGLMICYEDILPSFTRDLAKKEPQVMINVTNDAWFGKTHEPYLHLALSAMRAVESRVWLVRSTNTGVSAFIDAKGEIVSQTELVDPEVLVQPVAILSGEPTLYTRIGDVLGWLSIGLCLFVFFLIWRGPEEDEEDDEDDLKEEARAA